MSMSKVLIGGAIALLLGVAAYKAIEKYMEENFDFGFDENDIVGM